MAMSPFDAYGRINHQPIPYVIVAIPALSIYVVYVVATHVLFLYRALVLRDNALLERSVLLLTIQAVCGLIFTTNALMRFIIANYPCFIELWLMSFGYLTWVMAFFLFMIRYYFIFKSHNAVARETRVNPVTPENLLEYLARIEETAKRAYWMNDTDDSPHLAVENERNTLQIEARLSPASIETIAPWQTLGITDPVPPNSDLPQNHPSSSSLLSGTQTHGARPSKISRLYRRGVKKWLRFQFSIKYYVIIFCAHFAFIISYLALVTSLFNQLSLINLHYNCFFNMWLLPHTILSGIFNVVIGPIYIAIIWRFKDAYGIRTSMIILLTVGAGFWIAILIWRLDKKLRVGYISSSFPFSLQILIAQTAFVVVPLIKSIRFAKLKKIGLMTSERALENNSLGAGPHNTAEPLELNKRSFFETLRTSEGHEKVEKYAQGCFCPELLLFLDAYVAFKGCIFNELKQEYTLNEPKTEQSTHTPKSIYKQPAIHVINFHGNASQISSEVKSTEERASHASTRKQSMDDIAESAVSPPTTPEPAHSSNSSRKHMHIAHFLTPPNQDTATSASRESSISRITEPCIATSIEAANNSAAEALQCVAIGIAETMNFAFPQAGFTSAMTVPQSLRRQLSAIIRTFVLPTSALEINLTAEMVSEAQVYVEGGDMAFGTLDAIKNHVVELLYANVYIRLYQEVG